MPRLVRERMRRDPAVPAWARALLPAIAILQLATIHLVRPLYLTVRRFMVLPGETSNSLRF